MQLQNQNAEIKQAELFIDGCKASLGMGISCKGLWKISFALKGL